MECAFLPTRAVCTIYLKHLYYSALMNIFVLKRLQYGHHQKSSQIDMLRSVVTHVQIRIWIMMPLKTAWLFKVLFSIQASAFCNQFIITRGWDFPGWRTSSVSIYVFHFHSMDEIELPNWINNWTSSLIFFEICKNCFTSFTYHKKQECHRIKLNGFCWVKNLEFQAEESSDTSKR